MTLQVKDGGFFYGNRQIFKDINFELHKGEVLSILGPNGIGKTTLVKCITGLLDWHNGASFIDNKNISSMTNRQLWSKLSYVPQARYFSFSYTGLEMVSLGRSVKLSNFQQPSQKDLLYCKKIMEEIGISHLEDRDCNTMSGGELQMILIARALVSDPQIIILDEPESGLDFKNQLIVLDLIDKLAHEKGLIAIINTHYPENALCISDKCLLLSKDLHYEFGPILEILTVEKIKKAFEVEVLLDKIEKNGQIYRNIIPIKVLDK